jgi:hypothetical protein
MMGRTGIAVVLVLLLAGPSSAQEKAGYRYTNSFFPLGVRDPEGTMAYVAGPKDKILAVRLTDGHVLWSVPGEGVPLGLAGDRLIIQVPVLEPVGTDTMAPRNRVRLEVLDVKAKGRVLTYSQPIAFPEWVRVRLAYGRTFTSWGWADRGHFYLAWEATAFYAGGPPPTPEQEKADWKQAAGTVRVNWKTGKIKMLKADAAVRPGKALPAKLRDVPASTVYSEVASAMVTRRLVAGNILAALDWQTAQKQQRLVLKRWNLTTGAELPAKKLMEREALTAQLAHDGAHLLVHPTTAGNVAPADYDLYRVFSLATGDKIGQFRCEGGSLYTVIGTRVYYVITHPSTDSTAQPRTVSAVDLTTGRMIWELSVKPSVTLPPLP